MRLPARLAALVASALPSLAAAASISGTISGTTGGPAAPLAGMQVRAWLAGPKGYAIAASTTSAGDGTYLLGGLAAGSYKIDARMAPGMSGNWGDRWYDVALPTGSGYLAEDADVLAVADSDAVTAIDLTLEVLGGMDGYVLLNGALANQLQARAELVSDPRVHHNDVTHFTGGSAGPGYYYGMRGLPPGTYRVLGHDPIGGGTAASAPVTVAAGTVVAGPAPSVTSLPADPYEPNDAPAAGYPIDAAATVRHAPPVPFVTSGAAITPRGGGDVDFYCWDAQPGDRYLVDASAPILVDGQVRDDPWVDPVVSLWTDAGGSWQKLAEDDDSGGALAAPGPAVAAHLDREIARGGRLCAGVTTFGDTAWNGTQQQSAGAYRLSIAMGNRRPVAAGTSTGAPIAPGDVVTVPEAGDVDLAITVTDPDGDPLAVTATLVDALGAPVAGVTPAVTGDGTASATATLRWTPSQTAARGSPYLLTVTAADAELGVSFPVTIVVTAVNVAPEPPGIVSPDGGAPVATATPDLVFSNGTDVDQDTLTYELEVYAGDTSAAPLLAPVDVPQGAGATTTFTPATGLPENAHVSWRVRAFDGQTRSVWSPFGTFFVDTVNDAPNAPVLTKPVDAEVLLVRRPALAAENPVDPEGDAVSLRFEIATDALFTAIVAQSGAVPVDPATATTSWVSDVDLVRGGQYFARARATDARGGDSGPGPVIAFSLAPDQLPAAPALGSPFPAGGAVTLDAGPATIAVSSDADPDGDPLTIALVVLPAGGDPATATPLASWSLPRDASGTTTFQVPAGTFVAGTAYVVAARADDGMQQTAWTQASLTIRSPAGGGGGGSGGGSGGGGNQTGGGSGGGCGCTSGPIGADAIALLGLVALRIGRRRRPGR